MVARRDCLHLKTLRNHIGVRDHDCFRKPSRAAAKAKIGTDVAVAFAQWQSPCGHLGCIAKLAPLHDEFVDAAHIAALAVNQKDIVLGQSARRRRRQGGFHDFRPRKEKLGFAQSESMRQLLGIVVWGCAARDAPRAHRSECGDGEVDGILAKDDGDIAFLQSVRLDQGGGEMGRVAFYIGKAQVPFSVDICKAG